MVSYSAHIAALRSWFRRAFVVSGSAAALAAAGTGTAFAGDYYAGRTITLLVGLGGGAGGTQVARVIAKHLGKHIPGNPTVVVRNMPGAGTFKAQNFVMGKAPKDGTTVYYGPWNGVAQILNSPGMRFKYEDATPLGGIQLPGLYQWSVRGRVPGDDPARIKEMNAVRMGGTALSGSRSLIGALGLDLLGANFRFVGGYRGTGKLKAAILGNELDLTMGAIHQYNSQIKGSVEGATALWHVPLVGKNGGFIDNPNAGGVPSLAAVYKKVSGKDPGGIKWKAVGQLVQFGEEMPHAMFGPKEMNAEAARSFSASVVPALTSQAFRDESMKRFFTALKPKSAKEAGEFFGLPGATPPDVKAFLKEFIAANGK